jgi:hypothetical protein
MPVRGMPSADSACAVRCAPVLGATASAGRGDGATPAEDEAESEASPDSGLKLHGIVAKHAEPEDVLYAMMQLHRKDASNAFKQALQAFGVTWERKTRPAEKVPA